MDVNLTGALAANISLLQPSKTEYLPLLTQIMTTLLTAFVTLGAVYLSQYLSGKSDARKRDAEEKEKQQENKKNAYRDFMEVFSSPIESGIRWDTDFPDITREHLMVALRAVEFGDELADPSINLKVSGNDKEILSLSDLIKFILELRYRSDLLFTEKITVFKSLRIQAADRFSSSFLNVIIPNDF